MENSPLLDAKYNVSKNDVTISYLNQSDDLELYSKKKKNRDKLKHYSLFCAVTFLYTLCPIVSQWAMWDCALNKKNPQFLQQSPYIASFLFSVLLSNLITLFSNGFSEFIHCWNFSELKFFFPVGFFHGVSEVMELYNLQNIDATTHLVVNQFRLPFSAVLNYYFIGEILKIPQLLIISTIFLGSFGHIGGMMNLVFYNNTFNYIMHCLLTVVAAISSCFAGVMISKKTKELPTSYFVQISQIRFNTAIVSIFFTFIQLTYESKSYNIFMNWNYKVVILAMTLFAKDWMCIALLKSTNMLVFCFCTAASLCLTYLLDSYIFVQRFLGLSSCIFTLIIAINLTLYAIV